MKSIRFIMVLFATIAFSSIAFAQPGSATLNFSGAITLDTEQPLKSSYSIDASSFNFDSDQDAVNYFANKNSDFVSFRPSLQNDLIMIYLQLKKHPNWTIAQWNAHFEDHKLIDKSIEANQELTK